MADVAVPTSDLPSHLAGGGGEVPEHDLPVGLKVSAPNAISPPPPKEKPAFSGSFGNVTKNFPLKNPAKDVGAMLYGGLTTGAGAFGDMGIPLPSMGLAAGATRFPNTEEIRGELERHGVKPGAEEHPYVEAGEILPAVAGAAGLVRSGARAIPKLAKALGTEFSPSGLVRDLRGAESAERTSKLAESLQTGNIGKNVLSRATKAAARRKNVADKLYEVAKDRMEARFKKGDVWQTSPAGREFFNDIQSQLSTEKGTTITSDMRKVLTDLEHELTGTPTKTGVSYATPKVLTTTLRELREAAAGEPKEGFKAIGQQEAWNLANKLSASLGKWEPAHQSADFQYQSLTKKLYPEGVVPGKFSKEKKAATKAFNTLENQLKQGTIKPEEVTAKMRAALKSPAVTRLVKEEDARQINAELDAIDKIKNREEKVRRIAKVAAKAIGVGALAGLGFDLTKGGL